MRAENVGGNKAQQRVSLEAVDKAVGGVVDLEFAVRETALQVAYAQNIGTKAAVQDGVQNFAFGQELGAVVFVGEILTEEKVLFGGRLGEYRYYDMDQVIAAALERAEAEFIR